VKTINEKLLLTVVLICAASVARAETFIENFNNATLNTNLLVVSTTNGFSFALSGGQAVMSIQSSIGNGLVGAETYFTMIGDFTATIQCGRSSLAPDTEAGLAVFPGTNIQNKADIFFYGGSEIIDNIFIAPGFGSRIVSTTASSALFQIARTGNTLSMQYDIGLGFQTLHSATDTHLSVPLTLAFVLSNEYGDLSFHSAWFDNLTIAAAGLYPSPSGLSAIANTNILETALWQFTPTVSGSGYTFGLSNAPSGMSVDTNGGTISWTPTEAQGPSTNGPITYAVYQSGSTAAWTNFTVVVLESNLPPVLYVPGTQTDYANVPLTVTNTATDPDIPANTLTFALVSAPSGVLLETNTGVLTWTPNASQVGTNTITVSVTDYDPSAVNSQHLSVTNTFTVIVHVAAPTWTLQPSNQVASAGQGFYFTAQATGYPAPTYQWQFSTNGSTWVNISGATGTSFLLNSSGLTNIGYYQVVASNSQGTNISTSVSLTFLNLNMYAGLNILGPLGASYSIQSIPTLNGSNWTTLTNVSLPSQPYIYIDYNSPTNAKQFYRAVPE